MSALKNTAAALVLVFALPALAGAAVPASHHPHSRSTPARSAPKAVAPAWWLRLVRLWAGGGCILDPNGRCVQNPPPPPPATTQGGCILDPNGCAH